MSLTGLLLRDRACASGDLDTLISVSLSFIIGGVALEISFFLVCGMIPKTTFIYLPAGRIIACVLHLCASHQRACNGAHLNLLSVYITLSAIYQSSARVFDESWGFHRSRYFGVSTRRKA